jgi:hypothetical protein
VALYTFDPTAGGDSAVYLGGTYAGSGVVMPYPWEADPKLSEPGSDMVPPLGGRMQRISRLGARWSVAFSGMPALGLATARQLIALRTQARANAQTLVFLWPQPAFTAAIGAPAVNAAGQFGSSLVCSGFAAGVTIPAGTFFSVIYNGRNNLHATSAAVTASGGGAATLPIWPMLRGSPANAQGLAFAAPAIEGFVQGKSEDWELQMLAWTGLPSFTVSEPA